MPAGGSNAVALDRHPELLPELREVSDALVQVADFLDGDAGTAIGTIGGPYDEYLLPIADVAADHRTVPTEPSARDILKAWNVSTGRVRPMDAGHINDTYLVDDRYVLQRLNRSVFQGSAGRSCANLAKALAHEGGNLLLPPIPTKEGAPFGVDADGDTWRLFPHLPSRNFHSLPDELLVPRRASVRRIPRHVRELRRRTRTGDRGFP